MIEYDITHDILLERILGSKDEVLETKDFFDPKLYAGNGSDQKKKFNLDLDYLYEMGVIEYLDMFADKIVITDFGKRFSKNIH